jgi:hypothetical protein
MNNPNLKEGNIIILGSWNIAIINPFWLKKEFSELIEEEEKIIAEIIFGQNQKIRYNIKKKNSIIIIENNRLMISSKLINKENLLFVVNLGLGIFKKLPHTPITAIGHNFSYEINENEDFVINQFINTKEEFNFYNEFIKSDIIETQIKHTFYYKDYQLNIIYNNQKNNKNINFNFNYPTNSIDNTINAIKAFEQHYKESNQLITKVIKK